MSLYGESPTEIINLFDSISYGKGEFIKSFCSNLKGFDEKRFDFRWMRPPHVPPCLFREEFQKGNQILFEGKVFLNRSARRVA